MRRFTSRHTNRIDKKGRVSVPASFRSVLEESTGAPVLYLKPNENEGCIECLTEAFMAEVERRLDQLPIGSQERDDLEEEYFAESVQVRFDPEGRVMIPLDMKDFAGIDGEVVFVGKGSRFEIWEPEAQERRRLRRQERTSRLTLPKGPADSKGAAE